VMQEAMEKMTLELIKQLEVRLTTFFSDAAKRGARRK